MLGHPRASSVFPVPVRAALGATSHPDTSRINREVIGRGLSVQTWCIMKKIREVDEFVRSVGAESWTVVEVHAEISFATWNGGLAMLHRKTTAAGRTEREELIDARWPGDRELLWNSLHCDVQRDDLNDAFAALWTAERLCAGVTMRMVY